MLFDKNMLFDKKMFNIYFFIIGQFKGSTLFYPIIKLNDFFKT